MDTQELLKIADEQNIYIRDVDLRDLVPNVVDNVVVTLKEKEETNECVIYIPMAYTGEKLAKWKKGRGGVFSKDVKRLSLGKPHGKYVILEGEGRRLIARIVGEEEMETFGYLKVIDGKIKDVSYTVIRELRDDEEEYTTSSVAQDLEYFDNSKITVSIEEPEEAKRSRGRPLFDTE